MSGNASAQQLSELAAALNTLQRQNSTNSTTSANPPASPAAHGGQSGQAMQLLNMMKKEPGAPIDQKPPLLARNDQPHPSRGQPLQSPVARNQTECKFGTRCTRQGCWYLHPQGKDMDAGQRGEADGRRDRFDGFNRGGGGMNNFPVQETTNDFCEHCREGGDLLCCDDCPRVFHLLCLDPPIHAPPTSYWTCPACARGGGRHGNGPAMNNNMRGNNQFNNFNDFGGGGYSGGGCGGGGCGDRGGGGGGGGNDGPIRQPPPNYICKRCQKPGHYLSDCPTNVCFKCGGEGHIASNCQGARTEEGARKRQREEQGGGGGDRGGGGGFGGDRGDGGGYGGGSRARYS